MHEFTDGCSSQYKSRHCLDDLSFETTEYGYKVFHRNFFETSHAKGPQDAAGGFIKRQADITVLRGNTIIQNAKDLFSFCNNDCFACFVQVLLWVLLWWQPEPLSRNERGRLGALKSDSTHHFFRNACTKSGSLRFSQFSGCGLILSVYILMSFDFPFVRLFGVR